MESTSLPRAADIGPGDMNQSYRALRHGGASPARAGVELGLAARQIRTLEDFLATPGPGSGRPRFARHDEHAAAARLAGGYPVLTLTRTR